MVGAASPAGTDGAAAVVVREQSAVAAALVPQSVGRLAVVRAAVMPAVGVQAAVAVAVMPAAAAMAAAARSTGNN
jgi:hypothetical protein